MSMLSTVECRRIVFQWICVDSSRSHKLQKIAQICIETRNRSSFASNEIFILTAAYLAP